jgi:hypothetical protein
MILPIAVLPSYQSRVLWIQEFPSSREGHSAFLTPLALWPCPALWSTCRKETGLSIKNTATFESMA